MSTDHHETTPTAWRILLGCRSLPPAEWLRFAWQLVSFPDRKTDRISLWTSDLHGGFREIGTVDYPSSGRGYPRLEQLSWSPDQRLLGFVLANVLCVVRASQ